MKKVSILIIAFLFTTTFINSQNGICEGGDCENGYGNYYKESTNEIYNGYFKDGKFDGLAMYSNNEGYYYTQFSNGKMNGYTVYYQKGRISSGKFIDGIKVGPHFTDVSKATDLERLVITYDNGKEVSRETLLVNSENFKSGRDCITGNCKDGNGIFLIKAHNILVIGNMKNANMSEGEYLNLMNNNSDFFAIPKDIKNPYFKFSKLPMKEGGFLEMAAMYVGSKKNGQAVLHQTKSKQSTNRIYKDDKPVE